MSSSCSQFNSEQETILEFLERFRVQCSDQLAAAGGDGTKMAAVLVKALPVNIITDLQRRIKPTLLSAATYDELVDKLTSQFEVKHSVVGATVRFLNYKQSSSESIESYAKSLNDLASACKFKDCCRDRMLRDAFVSGLHSSSILSAVLHDCEDKTFNACVDKAKLVEQITSDALDIKLDPKSNNNSTNKLTTPSTNIPENYVCIRCGAKRKHLARNCFALKLKCNSCKKPGHIAKVCKAKRGGVNDVHDQAGVASNATYTASTRAHMGAPQPAPYNNCCAPPPPPALPTTEPRSRHVQSDVFCQRGNTDSCNNCCDSNSFLG